jgi:hypothetical protein
MQSYDQDLDKVPANHVPLSPLSFIERAASVYPHRLAVVHNNAHYTWAETFARCRRLASALEQRGIGKGDTVAAMLTNIPRFTSRCSACRCHRCRAEPAQHPARRRSDRLHSGPRRSEGRADRPTGSSRRHEGRAGQGEGQAAGHRHRGRSRAQAMKARRDRIRGAARRGRSGPSRGGCRRTNGRRSRCATRPAPPATRRAWSTTTAAPT